MKIANLQTFILLLSVTGILSCTSKQNIYYVDSENGSNTQSGKTPEEAWASLEKLNGHVFTPGDKILFKAGTAYIGQLKPRGAGAMGRPIIINMYGEGKKPAIHGGGKYQAAVLLENIEYWEVNNLEVTNTGPAREPGRRGVIIRAHNFGDCHHIILDSLEIHGVNGSLIKSEGGGSAILWNNSGDSIKTRFVGLIIQHCHLYQSERNGINSRGYTRRDNWHPSKGVVVRNNLLEQIPGDGIVPIGCDSAVIEHNVMRDCPDILPHSEAAAGIWPWSSDNTVIQYNEVSGHKAKWDGQGFDSDWNCLNTKIQYNYSHDNYGGFLLICNNGNNIGTDANIGTRGTIIRYNVSVNDGLRPYPTKRRDYFSPTMHISGPVENTKIYNNIIIIPAKSSKEIDRTLVEMDNWGGPWPEDTWFANNIIHTEVPADIFWGESRKNRMSNNLIQGTIEHLIDQQENVFKEPGWKNPGGVTDDYHSLENLKLKAGSPCINAGVSVATAVIEDFFGNKVSPDDQPDIGIHEYK